VSDSGPDKIKEKYRYVKVDASVFWPLSGRSCYPARMSSFFLSKPPRDQLDLHRVKAVFFDLDGTLIDVDMHRFVPSYLHLLTWQMRDHASPAHAVQVLHHAVSAMFANQDAARTLESILLETLEIELSISAEDYADCLERLCCDAPAVISTD